MENNILVIGIAGGTGSGKTTLMDNLIGKFQDMVTILSHDGVLTAANLCELCGRDKADVSRSVSAMESMGLLRRTGDNPYRARLKLTDNGRAAALSIREIAAGIFDRVGGELTPENREIFYKTLATVSFNLEEYCKKGF